LTETQQEYIFSPNFFSFALLIIIPLLFHIYISRPHYVCRRNDHAAHYHIFVLQVWDFIIEGNIWVGRERGRIIK
jgi:hypothetical protein